MGSSSYVQGLVLNVTEPFSAFIPYAARKFQVEGELDQFVLYLSKGNVIPLDKTGLDLDINPDAEILFANKSQPIPDSFTSPQDASNVKSPLAPRSGLKPAAVSVTGYVTLDKKKRYLVLDGTLLNVCRDLKEADKPLQAIDLSAGEYVLQTDDRDRKRFQFDLVSTKNRKDIMQFKLDSNAEFQQWLPSLEAVLGAANSAPSTPTSRDTSTSDASMRVFGAPLASLCGNEPSKVPYIVQHCIQCTQTRPLFLWFLNSVALHFLVPTQIWEPKRWTPRVSLDSPVLKFKSTSIAISLIRGLKSTFQTR